jgi:lipopolysaccharide transport system permease protein
MIAETLIEAGRPERHYWREVWRYRDLLFFLSWRDIVVRYRQTAIGVAWALLKPLLTVVIFTAVFGWVAKLPSEGEAPYALMVLAGLLPWLFFASVVNEAGASLVNNERIVTKTYFPRILVPGSAIAVCLVDFALSGLVLLGAFALYGVAPGARVLALPAFVLLAALAAAGPALLIAALNVRYRDVRFVVPFVLQLGLYVSPIGFSSSLIPERWRLLYSLNPMAGVIDGFRWSLLPGTSELYLPGVWLSLGISLALLWAGLAYFRATERRIADVI